MSARDFVVETGKSGIWYYRKWNSGHCELWASTYVNCAVNAQQGNVYRSDPRYVSLPFTIYNSSAQVTILDHNTWCSSAWFGETVSSIPIVIWRGGTYSAYNWNLKLYVIGRWKQ